MYHKINTNELECFFFFFFFFFHHEDVAVMVPMDTRMLTRVFVIFGSHTTEHAEYSHFINSRSCLYLPTFRSLATKLSEKKIKALNFFAIEKHIDQTRPCHRIDLSRSIKGHDSYEL